MKHILQLTRRASTAFYREHQMSIDDIDTQTGQKIKKAIEFNIAQDKAIWWYDKYSNYKETLDTVWKEKLRIGRSLYTLRRGQPGATWPKSKWWLLPVCKHYVEKTVKHGGKNNGEYFIHHALLIKPKAEKLGSYNTCHIRLSFYGQSF